MEASIINYLPRTSGLYLYIPNEDRWRKSYLPCSLTGVKVKASIVDMVSRVTLSQTFSNESANIAYEALYRFPLYENSAVCDFHMEHSGRKIVGIVKAEEDAIKTYETAKAEGKTAALVLQKEPDIFQTKVGNIPPKTSITVTLTYITPLKQDTESNAVRFTLPTVIAPRYGIPGASSSSNVKTSDEGFELSFDAKMPSQITSISSPSHPIAMTLSGSNSAQVTLSNTAPCLDKDIVILVTAKDVDEPRCIIETHPSASTKCAMLNLVPKFNLPRASTEVIFVIDRSGSMEDKVDTLKRSLQIFLKSLPTNPDIYFNICSFGSHYDFLFKDGKSKKYDSKTLKSAEDYVSRVDANYGGTEILNPLLECMRKRRTDCQTSIILLTDGQVYNTDMIISSIAQEKAKNLDKPLRIFSLGIGDAVSHHLVEGIARAGGGYSQLVMEQERLDRKVVRMLSAGIQAPLNDLHLDWPGKPSDEQMVYKLVKNDPMDEFEFVDKPTSTTFFDKGADDTDAMKVGPPPEPPKSTLTAPAIQQFPETIPPLYNVSRHIMFLLFPSSQPTPQDVTLKGTLTDGTVMSLDVPVTEITTNDDAKPILHTLAARTLLGELQENRLTVQHKNTDDSSLEDAVKQEGIHIGVKYGLTSKWTAFVAVDEQKPDEKVHGKEQAQFKPSGLYEGEYLDNLESNVCYALSSHPPPPPMPSPKVRRMHAAPTSVGVASFCADQSTPGGALFGGGGNEMRQQSTAYGAAASLGGLSDGGFKAKVAGFGGLWSSSKKLESHTSLRPQAAPGGFVHRARVFKKSSHSDAEKVRADVPSSPTIQPLTDEQKLHNIIIQQSSSGMFPPNVTLARQLGFDSIETVKDKIPPALKNVSIEVWVTILMCVFLEKKLASEKEAWELVVEKAWAYVASQVDPSKVAELKEAAGVAIAY